MWAQCFYERRYSEVQNARARPSWDPKTRHLIFHMQHVERRSRRHSAETCHASYSLRLFDFSLAPADKISHRRALAELREGYANKFWIRRVFQTASLSVGPERIKEGETSWTGFCNIAYARSSPNFRPIERQDYGKCCPATSRSEHFAATAVLTL